MSITSSGLLLAWDPLRPLKASVCARCGAAARSRCGGCRFAAFCDRACQRAGWAAHGPSCCGGGYAGYVEWVEKHTRRVGALHMRGAPADQLIDCYEEVRSGSLASKFRLNPAISPCI